MGYHRAVTLRFLLPVALASLACSAGSAPPAPVGPPTLEGALAAAEALVTGRGDDGLSCDEANGWDYAALRALDRSPDRAEAARAAAGRPRLGPLTHGPLFGAWHRSRTGPPPVGPELSALLHEEPSWYTSGATVLHLLLRDSGGYEIRRRGALGDPLASGRWRVNGDQLLFGGATPIDAQVVDGPFSYEMTIGAHGVFRPEAVVVGCLGAP